MNIEMRDHEARLNRWQFYGQEAERLIELSNKLRHDPKYFEELRDISNNFYSVPVAYNPECDIQRVLLSEYLIRVTEENTLHIEAEGEMVAQTLYLHQQKVKGK